MDEVQTLTASLKDCRMDTSALETIFADAIINCAVPPDIDITSGISLSEAVKQYRNDSLSAAEELRTMKRQMTETLIAADSKLNKCSSKVLELESVISLVRMEAEMRSKDISTRSSALFNHLNDLELHAGANKSPDFAQTVKSIRQLVSAMLELQSQSGSLPAESADLFQTVNTLNSALCNAKRKASIRIRKLTDENTDLEQRNRQLFVAVEEARVKLAASKEEFVKLQQSYRELDERVHQQTATTTTTPVTSGIAAGPDHDKEAPVDKGHSTASSSGSKALQMQILLLQQECAALRNSSKDKQQEFDDKINTLHAALVQAAKEHEHDRRQWKRDVSDLQQRLDTMQSIHQTQLNETNAKYTQHIADLEATISQLQMEQQRVTQQHHEQEHTRQSQQQNEQLIEQLQQEQRKRLEEIKSLQVSLQYTKESLRLSEDSLKNLRLQLRSKEKHLQEVLASYTQVEVQYESAKRETQEAKQALDDVQSQLDRCQAAHRTMQQDHQTLQDKYQQLSTDAKDVQERHFRLTVEHDRLHQVHHQLQDQLFSSRFDNDRLKGQLQQCQQQLSVRDQASLNQHEQLSKELDHARQQLVAKDSDIAQLRSDIVTSQRHTHELMDEFRGEIQQLQAQLETQQEQQTEQEAKWSAKVAALQQRYQQSQQELAQCRALVQRQEQELGAAVGKFHDDLASIQLSMAELNSLSFAEDDT